MTVRNSPITCAFLPRSALVLGVAENAENSTQRRIEVASTESVHKITQNVIATQANLTRFLLAAFKFSDISLITIEFFLNVSCKHRKIRLYKTTNRGDALVQCTDME